MDSNYTNNKAEDKLIATGVAKSIERHLDKDIETFIANSVSKRRSREQIRFSSIFKLVVNKSIRFLPLVISLGYIVYVAFALYSNPQQAIAVAIFTPFVLYICINRFSNGQFSKRLNRILKKLCTTFTPRKRIKLWIRR